MYDGLRVGVAEGKKVDGKKLGTADGNSTMIASEIVISPTSSPFDLATSSAMASTFPSTIDKISESI